MRRRSIRLKTPHGQGDVAGVELGPAARPLDILFLHANGFNALTYRHVFAELDPSLRLLAIDMRGHGLTTLPVPATHPGWQVFADDLLAVIGALGAPPRLIAGHSMGASTALLAARDLPEGVAQLMLFDPVILAPAWRAQAAGQAIWEIPLAQAALRRKAAFASPDDAFEAYDGRGAFRTWQEAMLRDYLQDGLLPAENGVTLACTPHWEAANFATAAIADPLAGLQACPMPVTLFTAAHGSTCALEDAALPPSVECHTLPGTSHFLPMERPGIISKALSDALTPPP